MFALVSHSCRSCSVRVALVSLVQHSYRTCVALVSLVSHSCCIRVARIWLSCCKLDQIVFLHAQNSCQKFKKREEIISPSSFHEQLSHYQSHVLALSTQEISSAFCSQCSRTKQRGWVNLRFYLFVSDLIRWNEKGRGVQELLLSPQGFESFHSDLPQAWWRNLVCVE